MNYLDAPLNVLACAQEPDQVAGSDAPTIFHEAWWLDAVSPGGWAAAEVDEAGRRVAWLPYVVTRGRYWSRCTQPSLAHLMGPVLEPKAQGRAERQVELLGELAAQLPRTSEFQQLCHPDLQMPGLQARGFDLSLNYVPEIRPRDADEAWRNLSESTRNSIRRARDRMAVCDVTDPEEFSRFYEGNVSAGGRRCYFDGALVPPLHAAATRHGQGRIVGVRDGQGLVAAVFYVWDRRRIYYFLTTRRADAHRGAVRMLVWDGLQQAARERLRFDFDGFVAPDNARFYAGFGAQLSPRCYLQRRTAMYSAYRAARDLLSRRAPSGGSAQRSG